MNHSPCAQAKDMNDAKAAEHGRSRHEGYKHFQHNRLQPAPLFFTKDSHPLPILDIYQGRSAFLIASGPSFKLIDQSRLRQPGIITMGLNNSAKTFRPNMWTSVDSPTNWIRSIWLDPAIQKFVPLSHVNKKLFDSNNWKMTNQTVGDCPNVIYFKRNEHFQARQFLTEDCFNWGNSGKNGGGRSVMLLAIRILYVLGFRKVYLLGCDFNMSPDAKYHFDQDRHRGSIKGNQSTYQKLNEWFKELRPLFEKEDYHVFNCNPESNLKAFKFISFEEAHDEALSHLDHIDVANERTRGLYDTDLREKEEGVGREMTWIRVNAPRGLKRCKYCGKKCFRASSDERFRDKVDILADCEHSRKKLWKKVPGGYNGDLKDVSTGLLPEAEAVANWNARFGKDGK